MKQYSNQFPQSQLYKELSFRGDIQTAIFSLDKQFLAYTVSYIEEGNKKTSIIVLKNWNNEWKQCYYKKLKKYIVLQLICFTNNNNQILLFTRESNKIFSIQLKAQSFTVLSEILEGTLETFFCYQELLVGYHGYNFKDAQPCQNNYIIITLINKFLLFDVNQKLIIRQFWEQFDLLSNQLIAIYDCGRIKYINFITEKLINQQYFKQYGFKNSFKLNDCNLILFSSNQTYGILRNLINLKLMRKINYTKDFSHYTFLGQVDTNVLFVWYKFNKFFKKKIDLITLQVEEFYDKDDWCCYHNQLLKQQNQEKKWKIYIKR